MYVRRRPSVERLGQMAAHQRALDQAVAERATYERGWISVGPLASGFTVTVQPRYFKESEGFVLLAGSCEPTVGQADWTTIFTLPAGYRPEATLQLFNGGFPNMVRIMPSGSVQCIDDGTVRFDGLRFRTN